MVYVRRKRRSSRRRRRKTSSRKKKKRSYSRRLKDSKINTDVERAALRVSRKVAQESRVNLCYRTFFNSSSDAPIWDYTNEGASVNFGGEIVPMHQIAKRPFALASAAGPAWQMLPSSGTRQGDLIKITGFTIGLRVIWNAFEQDAGTFEDDKSTLHWSVCGWKSLLNPYTDATVQTGVDRIPEPIFGDAVIDPGTREQRMVMMIDHRPKIEDFIPLMPWGFNRKLDSEYVPPPGPTVHERLEPDLAGQAGLNPDHRIKRIARGSITRKFNQEKNQIVKMTKYIKLKKPLTIQYAPTDTSGKSVLRPYKLFLSMRSSIPRPEVPEMEPSVFGFYKVHYFEP